LRENSEYKAALERQQFAQARASHLRLRLSKLSSVKEDDIPRDRVGFGSRVTVLDVDTKKRETYALTLGEFIEGDDDPAELPWSVMNHSRYAWSGSFGASQAQRTSQRWCAPSAKMVTAPSRPPVDTGTCTSRVAVP